MAKELKGTVKEILGTAFSVGCQVDGKNPKEVGDMIDAGEIESTFLSFSEDAVVIDRGMLTLLQFLTSKSIASKISTIITNHAPIDEFTTLTSS